MITVAIVEDEIHYNKTLKRALDLQVDFECVAQLYTGTDALTRLPELEPDVVLMDLQLHDYLGSEIIGKIKPKMPNSNFIVITSFDEDEKIFESLSAGAIGYLIKGENLENIIQAVYDANSGGVPMSNVVAQKVIKFFRDQRSKKEQLPELSSTEQFVLELLAQGQQYKEIAYSKKVSTETIKKHISNIYRKLGVNNKVEAINLLRRFT